MPIRCSEEKDSVNLDLIFFHPNTFNMKPNKWIGLLALCLSLIVAPSPASAQADLSPKSETALRLKDMELSLARLEKDLEDTPQMIKSASDSLRLELKKEIKKENEGILKYLWNILLGVGIGTISFFVIRNNLLKSARKNWEERLEEERKTITKEWDTYKEELEGKYKELRKASEEKLEGASKEIDAKIENSWQGQLSKIRGMIKEQAPKVAREELAEEVRKEVQKARKDLLAMFEAQDYEKQVKEQRRILAFSQSESDARLITERLQGLGFKKVKALPWGDRDEDETNIEVEASDLIIFDGLRIPTYYGMAPNKRIEADSFNKIQDEALAGFVDQFPSELCYILYRGGHSSRMSEYPTQVNFANTEFTLYPRIFETLVFRDLKLSLEGKEED